MYILGIHVGQHDSAACLFKDQELIAFCKEERLTREKNCGKNCDLLSIDEVLKIGNISRDDIDVLALTRVYVPSTCYLKKDRFFIETIRELKGRVGKRRLFRTMEKSNTFDEEIIIDFKALRKYYKLKPKTQVKFINHHYSHIIPCFKYTQWQKDALYISCDGGGDFAYYSAYYFNGKTLECLCGDNLKTFQNHQNEGASIGLAYCSTTDALGFMPNRHEGKVTGLAAFGKPIAGDKIRNAFRIENDYRVDSDFKNRSELDQFINDLTDELSREDMASSIQYATEKLVLDWIKKIVADRSVKYIGMSGGVFSNVLLNQKVSELPKIEETFVFPAMGDEGLPVGNCIAHLIEADGLLNIERQLLKTTYLGYSYTSENLIDVAKEKKYHVYSDINVPKVTAELLENHLVGAIFAERMEMGPRALGARTILANPSHRGINDSINDRLERTEFMPFAPYVLDVDACEVFEMNNANTLPCRYMTITTKVKEKYHNQIPAVVHIDGTARPQIVYREDNPLYYDILKAFKELTKIPCLVNTSFNAHEEPIINTPEEALNALKHNRIDFLVCDDGIISLDKNLFDSIKNNEV